MTSPEQLSVTADLERLDGLVTAANDLAQYLHQVDPRSLDPTLRAQLHHLETQIYALLRQIPQPDP